MKDLLEGRASIKSEKKVGEANSALQSLTQKESDIKVVTNAEGGQDKPRIETVSENDIIKRITIKCTCGKCVTLDCEY